MALGSGSLRADNEEGEMLHGTIGAKLRMA